VEIAARTEQHFCPIKHAAEVLTPHSRYAHFLPYADAGAYRNHVDEVRDSLADVVEPLPRAIQREHKTDDEQT
jgi:hypothetical protein